MLLTNNKILGNAKVNTIIVDGIVYVGHARYVTLTSATVGVIRKQ